MENVSVKTCREYHPNWRQTPAISSTLLLCKQFGWANSLALTSNFRFLKMGENTSHKTCRMLLSTWMDQIYPVISATTRHWSISKANRRRKQTVLRYRTNRFDGKERCLHTTCRRNLTCRGIDNWPGYRRGWRSIPDRGLNLPVMIVPTGQACRLWQTYFQ